MEAVRESYFHLEFWKFGSSKIHIEGAFYNPRKEKENNTSHPLQVYLLKGPQVYAQITVTLPFNYADAFVPQKRGKFKWIWDKSGHSLRRKKDPSRFIRRRKEAFISAY